VGLIDWSKWHVFWVDERFVPKDHPDSNYKLAFDGFLSMVRTTRTYICYCLFGCRFLYYISFMLHSSYCFR